MLIEIKLFLWGVHTGIRGRIYELLYRRYTVACDEVSFSEDVILDKRKLGFDSVHPRILYQVRPQIVTPLRMIFENSFNGGLIPRNLSIL